MMAILYIDKVHGSPELDLKLEISGNSVTATLYSANDYGGTFGYSNGIVYEISAGGVGFSINTGSFSYSKSGTIVKTGSGKIGNGMLEVRVTCAGAGSCFRENQGSVPTYNESKSSAIEINNLNVYQIAPSFTSRVLENTLILSYEMPTPPSNLNLSRTYLETAMRVSYRLGSGAFKKIVYGVKINSTGDPIFTSSTTNTVINLSDMEILAAYSAFDEAGISYPNNKVWMYIELHTESGNISKNFDITVGGTGWIKNNNSWTLCVPYKTDAKKPCIMYTNIGGVWKRGGP